MEEVAPQGGQAGSKHRRAIAHLATKPGAGRVLVCDHRRVLGESAVRKRDDMQLPGTLSLAE